jgi:broad specificity phosphatase PhoE
MHGGVGSKPSETGSTGRLLGKFYYRPPGGESWCDVILRLRGALDTMSLHHAGRRVLLLPRKAALNRVFLRADVFWASEV